MTASSSSSSAPSSSSDAFRALTLGIGSVRSRNNPASSSSSSSSKSTSTSGEQPRKRNKTDRDVVGNGSGSEPTKPLPLPKELDFFGSLSGAAGSSSGKLNGDSKGKTKRKDAGKEMSSSKPSSRTRSIPAPLTPTTLSPYLKQHRLKLTGSDAPLPLVSWSELSPRFGVEDWLIDALEEQRQWEMTSVQRAAIPIALAGRDLLAMAPTGTGKTMAYLLPLIHRLRNGIAAPTKSPKKSKKDKKSSKVTPQQPEAGSYAGPRALILSPTRELATQIYNETRKLLLHSPEEQEVYRSTKADKGKGHRRLKIALLTGKEKVRSLEEAGKGGAEAEEAEDSKDGDTNESTTAAVSAQISSTKAGAKYDLVIATPLRLVNAIQQEGWSLSSVTTLVLDESDTLMSSGFFLSQTDMLLSHCTHPSLLRLLFTATLPSSIETLSKSFLSPDFVRVISGTKDASSSNVSQSLQYVGSEEGKLLALRSMIKLGQLRPPTILFVQSIDRAKDLYNELLYDGLSLGLVHSSLSRTDRSSILSRFLAGDIWLLISTELLSRGMDFQGVSQVINYDFPLDTKSYIHRVGRTGRAGRKGEAVTFFTKEDEEDPKARDTLRSVVNLIKASQTSASSGKIDDDDDDVALDAKADNDAVPGVPAYLVQLAQSRGGKGKRKVSSKRQPPKYNANANANSNVKVNVKVHGTTTNNGQRSTTTGLGPRGPRGPRGAHGNALAPPDRQSIAAASGSRSIELHRLERREGKRKR